ncbi:MAG: hypothetical protein WD342_21145 [Verrucomicrobiales bacterium]
MISFATAQEGFEAGASAVETTPEVFPVRLRSGSSTLVHDPLHARAVAFQNGEGRVAIALVDAIGLSREELDEAKIEAAKATGWQPEEMLIAATHAHTTPGTHGNDPGSVAYREKRFKGMVQSITDAVTSLEPAQVGFGSEDEPSEIRNRRWFLEEGTMPPNPFGEYDKVQMNPGLKNLVKPAAPIDPEICVVDVQTRRGRPLALFANYALHYVGNIPSREVDGREMGMTSADYFGEFARVMPYRIDRTPSEDFVAFMTNGTSGDLNNLPFGIERPFRAPFEQCRIVASKAADAAWRAVRDIEYDGDPIVAIRQREVALEYRRVTEEQVVRAMKTMEQISEKDEELFPKKALQYARNTVKYQTEREPEKVIVQAIRIGDQAICALPFEVLVEIGLELKAKSPFPHTFTIELANGSYGYLPPPNQHELGGYETWIGTSRFVPESSEILVKNLLEMLAELREM